MLKTIENDDTILIQNGDQNAWIIYFQYLHHNQKY